MVDLTREMSQLLASLGEPQRGASRCLMFVSATSGEGVSTIAREFARCEAAVARKPVWLVDADLKNQTQLQAVMDDPDRFGPAGNVCRATPENRVFFSTHSAGRDIEGGEFDDTRLLVARPFMNRMLWVTRFRQKLLNPGQKIRLDDRDNYFATLKRFAQTVVVDVPALDRGGTALALAPKMDGVIMVVSEHTGDIQSRLDLKSDLEQVGANLLGVVYNRTHTSMASRLTKRLVRA